MLFDRRGLMGLRQRLDIGRDVVSPDKLADVMIVEPGKEPADGYGIGGARIQVPDVRGEEIDEPQRCALDVRCVLDTNVVVAATINSLLRAFA